MTIGINEIITWVGMAIGLIGVLFRGQFKVERLEEKHNEVVKRVEDQRDEDLRQIAALWKWKDEHSADDITTREKFNKEISEVKGGILVSGEQFKQILSMLQDLKERMIKLENK